jgi:hypothetical protein
MNGGKSPAAGPPPSGRETVVLDGLGGSQDKPERGNALVKGVLSGTATCLLRSEPSGHSAEDGLELAHG